jgi:Flp pilus assembly protein TadG
MKRTFAQRLRAERGVALIEAAITLPLLLLVSVSIFEFGRAYQHWQVVTNASREGARVAVLPDVNDAAVTARVKTYLEAGYLTAPQNATVAIDRGTTVSIGTNTAPASKVTVNYPFEFMVLQPVAQLVVSGSTAGRPITMTASTTMRNE